MFFDTSLSVQFVIIVISREHSIESSTFFYRLFHKDFSTFSRDGRRGRSTTARALNFYTLLGAAAAKSTISPASKTASARLPRSPVVALINRLASIVRFNKVQQSGTQYDGVLPHSVAKRFYTAFISYPPTYSESHFSLRVSLFFSVTVT